MPTALSPMEIEAFRYHGLAAVYADEYEPRYPTPYELFWICLLVPIAALCRAVKWGIRTARDFGVIVLVVGTFLLGALWMAPPFLQGGAR